MMDPTGLMERFMSGALVNLIIQLISGAVGGNIAGSAMKDYNLGPIGNSIAGIIGGGIGGQILSHFSPGMAQAASTLDWGAIIGQVASGGIGGAILMVVVGMLKGMMAK
jgi:uncharacterized membrane protein YeaQ/YmgE (transglycosylase-associated protein family)